MSTTIPTDVRESNEFDSAVNAAAAGVPMLQSSIERRNPFVDPLSYIQLVLLQRLRRGEQPADELLTACLESINGIAAGLKNTG